jgi:hypothetical protein
MGPSRLEEKHRVPSFFSSLDLVWITANRHIGRDDDQILFFGQSPHPNGVFNVGKEIISKMNDAMVRRNHFIEPVR